MYQARESAMLGYAVAGLLGLGILYQLFKWCRYKIHKVKEDKKRIREMLAQDLPGKSRYPIFSAAADFCCTLDAEEPGQDTSVGKCGRVVVSVVPFAPVDVDVAQGTYKGQGAYVDGPASFVDLEANFRPTGSSSGNSGAQAENRQKMTEDEQQPQECDFPAQAKTASAGGNDRLNNVGDTQEGEVSDMSVASSVYEETVNHASNPKKSLNAELYKKSSDTAGSDSSKASVGSNVSHSSEESWEMEPSDDDDVVYSLSSTDGDRFNGSKPDGVVDED